jgi:hypothetical protein
MHFGENAISLRYILEGSLKVFWSRIDENWLEFVLR